MGDDSFLYELKFESFKKDLDLFLMIVTKIFIQFMDNKKFVKFIVSDSQSY